MGVFGTQLKTHQSGPVPSLKEGLDTSRDETCLRSSLFLHSFIPFFSNTYHSLPACQNHLGSSLKVRVLRTLLSGPCSSRCGERPGRTSYLYCPSWTQCGAPRFSRLHLQMLVLQPWDALPHPLNSYSTLKAQFKIAPSSSEPACTAPWGMAYFFLSGPRTWNFCLHPLFFPSVCVTVHHFQAQLPIRI